MTVEAEKKNPLELSGFDFELPDNLIAQYPTENRDESRLLYYSKSKNELEHKKFKDIVDLVQPGDILVRNNSKVLAARFFAFNENNSKVEVLLLSRKENSEWKILAKPGKRIKEERKKFKTENGLELELYREGDEFFVDFFDIENEKLIIETQGQMPIPPYMKREAEELDKERYQTIYAKDSQSGSSVAAPTAGLHFTPEIDQALKDKGVEIIEVTLHVGIGTFAPIKDDNITKHKMHFESYEVSKESWQKIQDAKKAGRKIITVGSTSTRVVESIAITKELQGETDIFIFPGFEFKISNAMVTNFHLPKSSLIVMISALLGQDKVQEIYKTAVENEYRFYSYGDACFFDN